MWGNAGSSARGAIAATMAAVLGTGCDLSGYWEPDDELCGLRVKWNGQGDRASLCPEVEACRSALGYAFEGAAVEFVADLVPTCLREHVAGCYTPEFDHIYLARTDRIGDTALCHELLHRALSEERDGDPDYAHRDPLWRSLP